MKYDIHCIIIYTRPEMIIIHCGHQWPNFWYTYCKKQ